MADDAVDGHRKRLRERYRRAGAKALHDYEFLELLLTYAIPRRDVKPVARALLHEFGDLTGVLDAGRERLQAVAGISECSASLIGIVRDLCAEYLVRDLMKRPSLSSPPVVADYARTLIGGREYEAFLVFYLDTRNRLIAHEILHEGTVDQAAVYPRNVVRNALDKNASSVIAVHNHPSGDCTPSSHDIGLTRNLKQAVTAVGLRMLDHLIVSRGGHLSFSEQGLL